MRSTKLAQHTQEIIQQYRDGANTVVLAERYGARPVSVRKLLLKNGVEIRGNPPRKPRVCQTCGGSTSHGRNRLCVRCFYESKQTPRTRHMRSVRSCSRAGCSQPLNKDQDLYCSVECRQVGLAILHVQKPKAPKKTRVRKSKFRERGPWPAWYHVWTEAEIEVLRANYPSRGCKATARILGLKDHCVIGKARALGIKVYQGIREAIVSRTARHRMLTQNPAKTPEGRKKISDRMKSPAAHHILVALKRGCERQSRQKPSGLELKLRAILESKRVQYLASWECKPGLFVDIKIGRLIIQADGDYWHGHPRFEPLTDRMKAQQARDRSHDKYLKSRGFAVERIWECEMSEAVVQEVLDRHRHLLDQDAISKASSICNSRNTQNLRGA